MAATGNKVAGLWYPIAVALMTFVIGSLFLKESSDVKIWDEVAVRSPRLGPPATRPSR